MVIGIYIYIYCDCNLKNHGSPIKWPAKYYYIIHCPFGNRALSGARKTEIAVMKIRPKGWKIGSVNDIVLLLI